MDAFPAFYPLKGRRVVIAGEGEAAEAKARLFEGSPAEVVRLGREAALDPSAYAGAGLVFVASYDGQFAKAAAAAARSCGAPLNVVDRPELSDFHTPAIVDRGAVVAAIGTAGSAPMLASLLRSEIETRVPAGAGRIAALLGERREALRAAFPDLAQRRAFLRAVLAGPAGRAAADGDTALAAERLDAALAGGATALGSVSFIVSPEAPDLVSLRSVRALNIADVVAAGPEAAELIASHARRDAEHLTLEGADASTVVALASAGRRVAIIVPSFDAGLFTALATAAVATEVHYPARAT